MGEVLIFESVRDYIREKQSINQVWLQDNTMNCVVIILHHPLMQDIEGRFTVQASHTSHATNLQLCSLMFLAMSSLVFYLC